MTSVRQDTIPTLAGPQFYAVTLGVSNFDAFTWEVQEESVIVIEVKAIAHRAGSTDAGSFWRVGTFKREAGGSATQVGQVHAVTPDACDADLMGATVQFLASGNNVIVRVVSVSASNYWWHCSAKADVLVGAA